MIRVEDVEDVIRDLMVGLIGSRSAAISRPAPLSSATGDALTFCAKEGPAGQQLVRATPARIVVCHPTAVPTPPPPGKTLLLVENPRLAFARILREKFARSQVPAGIHPSAVISESAEIDATASIGPFSFVGAARIGPQVVLGAGVQILDNVTIGKRVEVQGNVILGSAGFGFERGPGGGLEFFPTIGTLTIEDDVSIHANTNIDCGTLGETRVGAGTKIDKFCHIGHNVQIGAHNVVAARAVMAGGAQLGSRSYLAPCVTVREKVRIGSDVFIGMGSLVMKDVADGSSIMGVPAGPIESEKKMRAALKRLSE